MSTLSFSKKELPFLWAGASELTVDIGELSPHQPLPDLSGTILTVTFKGAGKKKISLGGKNSCRFNLDSATQLTLTPVFATAATKAKKLLKDNALETFFLKGKNADKVILVLDTGLRVNTGPALEFSYAALTASTALDLDAGNGFAYARAFAKTLPLERLIGEFFRSLRLPAPVTSAPAAGEALSLRYDGYLRLDAAITSSYRLKRTAVFTDGRLELSGQGLFNPSGKASLSAAVAGNFAITITAAEALPGWARVKVTRRRARDLKIAADVKVNLRAQVAGFAATADELLAAALELDANDFNQDRLPQPASGAFRNQDSARGGGIRSLLRRLATAKDIHELLRERRTGELLRRLLGQVPDSAAAGKETARQILVLLENFASYKNRLFSEFKKALTQTCALTLHTAYSQAAENTALLDVEIDPAAPGGAELLGRMARGDFRSLPRLSDPSDHPADVAASAPQAWLRWREGQFTRRLRKENAFKVNISGWGLHYRYEGFDRVITQSEKRIVANGPNVEIYTATELELAAMRRRRDEETQIKFILQTLGETAGVITPAEKNSPPVPPRTSHQAAAVWQLRVSDDVTSAAELAAGLRFARQVGLDRQGATLAELRPLLPQTAKGDFGKIVLTYEVTFDARDLAALLTIPRLTPEYEDAVRSAMRELVLLHYRQSGTLASVAAVYADPAVFALLRREGSARLRNHSQRTFSVTTFNDDSATTETSATTAREEITLDRAELEFLVTLYEIENEFIVALGDFFSALAAGRKIAPATFEKKLSRFGAAMQRFDRFDQSAGRDGVGTSTIFIMFDRLITLASGSRPAHRARLRLQSQVAGQPVEKIFQSAGYNQD